MRLATLLIVGLLALAASARAADVRTMTGPTVTAAPVLADAAQNPPAKAQIDVNVNHGHAGRWYASPVWIAIGVLALIVLILLIVVLATRSGGGGGTTIVRG